ncbi:hypothetical protein BJ741DRAFT_588719 [Chytriomyces cf. hyalinus JEL632]|nr:hypothetical protein BJ741DRAFT_588719 [Chytriomyces cf. hyalinus JEL632]
MVPSQDSTPQPTDAAVVPKTELQVSRTADVETNLTVPATHEQTEPITADASVALTVPVTADQTVPSTDASINLAVTDQTEPTEVVLTESMGLETQPQPCATAESPELAASGPSKTSVNNEEKPARVQTSPSRKKYEPVVTRIPRKSGTKKSQNTASHSDGTSSSSTSPVRPTTPVQTDSATAKNNLEKHSPRSSRGKSSPLSKSQRKMPKAPASPKSQREPKTPTKPSRNKVENDLASGMRNLNVNQGSSYRQSTPVSIPRTPVRDNSLRYDVDRNKSAYQEQINPWSYIPSPDSVIVKRNGVEAKYNNIKYPAAYLAKIRATDRYAHCWAE